MSQSQSPAAPSRPWRRYALIGVPLLVALLVLFLVFWPRIRLGFQLNALNADDAVTRQDNYKRLVKEPREAWVEQAIVDKLADADSTFTVRYLCAGVLIDRGSHAELEQAYLDGTLDVRSAVLDRWRQESYFQKTYANDERYAVRKTVRDWLSRDGDWTRARAMPIAIAMDLRDLMPLVRPLLVRNDDPHANDRQKRQMLVGAIGVAQRFADCESVPQLARLARNDSDSTVRMRAMQHLDLMTSIENAPCADAVDEAEMQQIVSALLESDEHVLQLAAMRNMINRPARAKGHEARLGELLAPRAGDASKVSVSRNSALQVLFAMGDPAFLEEAARWFHDDQPFLRSTCASRAATIDAPRLDGCLVGLLERELESIEAFRAALGTLRSKGPRGTGFSERLEGFASTVAHRKAYQEKLGQLFAGETVEQVTRASLVRAWFDWLAGDLGLDAAATEAAWQGRAAFWTAADAGDLDGARAALAGIAERPADLFRYEEAWLALQQG